MFKKYLFALIFTLMLPSASPAEVAMHKTLKAYQELKLDVCVDLAERDDKNLEKHLAKTQRFIESKRAQAKGRSRKMLRNSADAFDRLITDIQRQGIQKEHRIDQAFLTGLTALKEYLKKELKQLEILSKQGGGGASALSAGKDQDYDALDALEKITGGQLPDEDNPADDLPLDYQTRSKAGDVELDCKHLLTKERERSWLEKLF